MESSLFWKLAKLRIQEVDSDTLDELGNRQYYKELLTSAKTAAKNETITDSALVSDINSTNFRASRHAILKLIKRWFDDEKSRLSEKSKKICLSSVREMGITQKLQSDFGIAPAKYVRNPHYRSSSQMHLFNKFDLELMIFTNPELSQRVDSVLERRQKRKAKNAVQMAAKQEQLAAQTKEQREIQNQVNRNEEAIFYIIYNTDFGIAELTSPEVIESTYTMLENPQDLISSWKEMINFIREDVSIYDDILDDLKQKYPDEDYDYLIESTLDKQYQLQFKEIHQNLAELFAQRMGISQYVVRIKHDCQNPLFGYLLADNNNKYVFLTSGGSISKVRKGKKSKLMDIHEYEHSTIVA
ncbi:hypothetical protein NIES267_69740 [Calothrix parasitica NIES-267]|uniref:Uncharacterized protein n=1 Tax=Calothrix parasitica NIES-267 TaxID=1973488 RepID=A0A1Z4M1U2_9CYAN|nr:hypothetical protein NIES267_69740 [Calothrix parasitica NIES-267]